MKENEVEVSQALSDAKKGDDDRNIDAAMCSGDEASDEGVSSHLESVAEEHTHALSVSTEEFGRDDADEDDAPDLSMNDYEIPDCSLGEASLSFNDESSDEVRRRLASQSDANVDIRNLILGRSFVLCVCDNVRVGI